ncbi:hypothetical protein GGI07_005190 [Coemansia sp. Benny D115]|nr:hypothetical protein GGI07_005190 [Coemansia sp. Benny D115]
MTLPPNSFRPAATNSLVILFDQFTEQACDQVHQLLTEIGPLWHFATLKSFERCLAVFVHTGDAQEAVSRLHLSELSNGNTIKLYYSMHTTPTVGNGGFLNVPEQEKLWLISPPGSPPLDWRQTREEPPNAVHLEGRLHRALRELSMGRFVLNPADISDYESDEEFSLGPSALPGNTLRTGISRGGVQDNADGSESSSDKDEESEKSGPPGIARAPTIVIQNFDHVDDGPADIANGGGVAAAYSPTARPPL